MDCSETAEVVRPPFPLIFVAGVSAVLGAAMLPLLQLGTHLAGYLLSSVVCFLFVARYAQVDQQRAARPVDYRPWSASRVACTAVLTFGLAVACVHAWYIANELAVM